ncbi:hypothetical protein BC629DRAFT_1445036 [Irpex lacteus]|nr:hypothetical protein BC629DRAFT_1445036 [Irpex lacteus]
MGILDIGGQCPPRHSVTEPIEHAHVTCRTITSFPQTLSVISLYHFIIYSDALKSNILLAQTARDDPRLSPDFIPPSIELLLAQVMGVPAEEVETVRQCWLALRHIIRETDTAEQLLFTRSTLRTHAASIPTVRASVNQN